MLLLAIDGNSLLNRAFYGVRPLTTKEGIPTNAIFGFLNILRKLEKEYIPDRVVVCFDVAKKTFRNTLFPNYKGNRKGMPEDLATQLPLMKELLIALGYPVLGVEGFEADDLLGTLANACEQSGEKCVIATGDRDSFQLVSDSVRVHLAGKAETLVDKAYIREHYGVEPVQMIQVKAIMGDTSDNIPGVAGIGEKGALKLIGKFGSLDGVYENLSDASIPPRQKELLTEHKEIAYLSLQLATISKEAPIDCVPAALNRGPVDQLEAAALLKKLELYSMYDKLGVSLHPEGEIRHVETYQPCGEETFWKQLPEGECVGISLQEAEEAVVGAFAAAGRYYLTDGPGFLRGLSRRRRFACYDLKNLWHQVEKLGGNLPEACDDLLLMAYLQNPVASGYPADRFVEEAGVSLPKEETAFSAHLAAAVSEALPDARRKLDESGQRNLYEEIERPLSYVLAEMESAGFGVDIARIGTYQRELDRDIASLEEQIYLMAGRRFTITSPKQLGEVLFEELRLPTGKKTKTGYSTNAEVLEELADKHPIASLLLEHRQLTKLRSTYTAPLAELADENGRIHTSFVQTETRTGRISSQNPNLQNIPVRTQRGREIRRFFVAKEGCVLVDADYSQIELRVLAHLSEDPVMCRIFSENGDIHTKTAMQVFHVPEEFVTSERRRQAKAVNFGIVYGMGAFRLANEIHVSMKEAKNYIDRYFESYPGVKAFMDRAVKEAEESGHSKTMFGRLRPIPELRVTNKVQKAMAERIARNSPIQGTAADIIKIAMVKVAAALKSELPDARLILQVHDELIVECKEQEAEKAAEILRREMEGAVSLRVPLLAEANCGRNWFEAKEG